MAGTLDSLFGAGIKNVQTGYVTSTPTASSGEDTRYIDITISAVADTTKAVVSFEGGAGENATQTFYKSGGTSAYDVTTRFTSATNIRVATTVSANRIAGRWTVVE